MEKYLRFKKVFRKANDGIVESRNSFHFALDFFTTLSIAVVAVLLKVRSINEEILLFPALTILILSPEYFYQFAIFQVDYHATFRWEKMQ